MTLVELLISLALSLMVIGGAVSIFISTKESLRLEEDLSVLQENFRFISGRLHRDISQVGFMGCVPPYKDGSPTIDAFVTGVNVADLIRGTEGGANPDEITVSYALPESGSAVLDGVISNKSDPVPVSANQSLFQALKANFALASPKPTTLLVGNCNGANIFLVTGVNEQGVDLDNDTVNDLTAGMIQHVSSTSIDGVSNDFDDLSYAYGALSDVTAKVFELEEVSYKIDTISGVTGLYERRNSGSWNLLFEDITDMQILYGIASGSEGSSDYYVDWSSAVDIATITSIRVTLTMVVTQTDGGVITQDYTFVIKLRNMGLA
jgi:type IV pilus assembly protein PilW